MSPRRLLLPAAMVLAAILTSSACGQVTGPGGSSGQDKVNLAGIGRSDLASSTAGGEDVAATSSAPPAITNPSVQVLTQARGNPLRKRILDVLREDPQLGSERGTLFVVRWLAVKGDWAMFQGETEAQLTPIEALLRKIGGEWTVVELASTGDRRIAASRYPKAPWAIFGPSSFSLAPRVKPEDQLLILTNARGNATRTRILDALRARFSPSTKFVVQWLRVKNGWAYFYGKTVQYEVFVDAILRHRSWGWEVVEIQGEGDFPESIPEKYSGEAPRAIFP